MSKTKTEKTPAKKMTQAERDAIFGTDETTVHIPSKKEAAKAPAKKEAAKAPAKKEAAKAPAKKEAEKTEDKVHGRIASTNARKLKSSIGDCTKKSYVAIAAVFGKGKTIEDAVTDLEISYEPPRSAEFAKNPRKYLLGYITSMVNKKLLTEA